LAYVESAFKCAIAICLFLPYTETYGKVNTRLKEPWVRAMMTLIQWWQYYYNLKTWFVLYSHT